MNVVYTAVLLLLASGTMLIFCGLAIRTYQYRFSLKDLKKGLTLEKISGIRYLRPLLTVLSGKDNSKRYKLTKKMISRSETEISVHALYLLKFISLFSVAVISVLVSYTNFDVKKTLIISSPQGDYKIFDEPVVRDYSRSADIYETVIEHIGEEAMKKFNSNERLATVKKILPGILGTGEKEVVEENGRNIVKSYELVSRLKPINHWVMLVAISSFWLPETVLLMKRLLLGNRYRKEVIKLENILELLGSVRNFKTIDILDEMSKASKIYRKHLEISKEIFKTDKEQALEMLKVSVRNSRFSRLVDILRVYSMTDKKLALQIMERNRIEKEEELLLTAEEDIDLVDLVAFISILPIVLQLANLLMKPMLDTIYEAFKFI